MAIPRPFLTAQWRNLVMLNYDVDSALLEPFVPPGTELDLWQGRALISLVGFQFLKTRLKGWAIPWHQNFDEVNLRFYVRRETADGCRRGVVFLKEIAPKPCVSWVANLVYHEHYLTLPMTHRIQLPGSAADRTGLAEYRWRSRRNHWEFRAEFHGLPLPLRAGSEEEFIAEHYWAYTKQPDCSTLEYRVDHPPWRVWPVERAEFHGDATELYGGNFAAILRGPPSSALVAGGSPVTVFTGQRLACAVNQENYASAMRR